MSKKVQKKVTKKDTIKDLFSLVITGILAVPLFLLSLLSWVAMDQDEKEEEDREASYQL